MKFSSKITKFQEGGPMPEEQGAPMEGGAPAPEQGGPAPEEAGAPAQGSPEQQLQQLAGQLLDMLMQQIGDPQAVMAVLQMAMDMLGQAAQGGPQEAPVMQRQGGRLVRVRR